MALEEGIVVDWVGCDDGVDLMRRIFDGDVGDVLHRRGYRIRSCYCLQRDTQSNWVT